YYTAHMEVKMLTIQQVKAARALIDWKQEDLADASGISVPAIARLEQGVGNSRASTLSSIRTAFEKNGVEFLDSTHGVQLRQEGINVEVMRGREGVYRLFADIEITLAHGGELLICGVDEPYWISAFGDKFWATLKRRISLGIEPRL